MTCILYQDSVLTTGTNLQSQYIYYIDYIKRLITDTDIFYVFENLPTKLFIKDGLNLDMNINAFYNVHVNNVFSFFVRAKKLPFQGYS